MGDAGSIPAVGAKRQFCRIHKTLRVTHAMAAGLTDKLMGFEDIVALIDAAAPPPGRPKTYKKRQATA